MLVTVRENLVVILDYFWFFFVNKVWIDAVCINQDNINECNAQVLRIRDIFS
jgi:Heterokaryon incompatibility protein (HET)